MTLNRNLICSILLFCSLSDAIDLAPQIKSSVSPAAKKILVSIGGPYYEKNYAEANEFCQQIAVLVQSQNPLTDIQTNCVYMSDQFEISKKIDQIINSEDGNYSAQIQWLVGEGNTDKTLRIIDYEASRSQDPTTRAVFDWKINAKRNKPESQQQILDEERVALAKLIVNFIYYQNGKTNLKLKAMFEAVKDGKDNILYIDKDGQFIDKLTEKKLKEEEALALYSKQPENIHYLRATLEISAVIGVFFVQNYLKTHNKKKDFESIGDKFDGFNAWRFDDNGYRTNAFGHPFLGAESYQIARSNGFGRGWAFFVTFAASSVWEYFAEYGSVVSINDQIMTAEGGMVLGETLRQSSIHLYQMAQNSTGAINKYSKYLLSLITDPWFTLNRYLDNKTNIAYESADFPKDKLNRFFNQTNIGLGYVYSSSKGTRADKTSGMTVRLTSDLNSITDFFEEGKTSELLFDNSLNELDASLTLFGKNGIADISILAKTMLVAYHNKNIRDRAGEMRGHNLVWGLSNGLDINYKAATDKSLEDFAGVIHILGNTIDLTGYYKGLNIRLTLDVFADFAMVRSYAVDDYIERYSAKGLPLQVGAHHYYYGIGPSEDARLTVSKGPLQVGVLAKNGNYSSISGRSRFEERVTKNLKMTDNIYSLKVWLSYLITNDLSITVYGKKTVKDSQIKDFEDPKSNTDNEAGVELNLVN